MRGVNAPTTFAWFLQDHWILNLFLQPSLLNSGGLLHHWRNMEQTPSRLVWWGDRDGSFRANVGLLVQGIVLE